MQRHSFLACTLLVFLTACSEDTTTAAESAQTADSTSLPTARETCATLGISFQPLNLPDSSSLILVTNYADLLTAISAGYRYIKIPAGVTIELPNQSGALSLGLGQTLFGERGQVDNPGKLVVLPLETDSDDKYPVITLASHSRISGLIIEGPVQVSNSDKQTIGMKAESYSTDVMVDNNEIYGWPWAGVSLKQSHQAFINNNYIHHNIKSELGYGVVVQNGDTSATIQCNIFSANRHAIAGSGKLGEGYLAQYNLVMQDGGRGAYHQFDMHQGSEGYGGSYVHVMHNWFNYGDYGTSNRSSVGIRGIPEQGPATVEKNIFKSQYHLTATTTTVTGVSGSIPSEQDQLANNTFGAVFDFSRIDDQSCEMQAADENIAVSCAAVGLGEEVF